MCKVEIKAAVTCRVVVCNLCKTNACSDVVAVDYEVIGTAVFSNRNMPVGKGCTNLCVVISAVEIVFEVKLIVSSLNNGNVNGSILDCEPADKVVAEFEELIDAHSEVRMPINYYQTKDYECVFLIITLI